LPWRLGFFFCRDHSPQPNGLQKETRRKNNSNVDDERKRKYAHIHGTTGDRSCRTTAAAQSLHREQDRSDKHEPHGSDSSEDEEGDSENEKLISRHGN